MCAHPAVSLSGDGAASAPVGPAVPAGSEEGGGHVAGGGHWVAGLPVLPAPPSCPVKAQHPEESLACLLPRFLPTKTRVLAWPRLSREITRGPGRVWVEGPLSPDEGPVSPSLASLPPGPSAPTAFAVALLMTPLYCLTQRGGASPAGHVQAGLGSLLHVQLLQACPLLLLVTLTAHSCSFPIHAFAHSKH